MPSLPSLDSTPRFIRISTPCTHFYNLQGMFLGLYFHSSWVDAFINALFLWQVLHLMNKMNLPAPFRMALPTPPLPSQVPAPPHPPPPPQPEELRSADLSSDESELESSDVLATSVFLVPPCKSFSNHSWTLCLSQDDVDKRKSKRAKHEAIVGPAVDKSVAHEAVGVKPAALVSTELQVIKKKNPVLQVNYSLSVYPLVENLSALSFPNAMVLFR